ncbi:L(+)-tartrate dehydratase subunit beta [Corynebacterium aurimucosum]|uniref:L(+)-tartrate dehydratase subunit beta n=1 Tax=Corynebacterium aurimucosum TaxID=169292 RepID=UPI000C8004CC|nr:L(+)-tartrate dehydratase subunit beta [Corynebacterium aurimucosum]PMC72151.1 L(+)-tartrate dehydratase subunit beta [Corynebacterium aurimucosum]QQU96307.1 L(+)-tartrate dehydratase subunit beta [Corynebacterium aurimucosum]UTA70808.1 L(+)-tartrate dehydratase subunit beta [Corynebacterium aurimucosum]WJY71423.1 L(+)-tartrate dehydratase subunit beta [Corynebacterium aurimucosum]
MSENTTAKTLTTPISQEDLQDIKAGDVIFLDGYIVTCRDVGHRRVVELGRELPIDLKGGAILHAGPIMQKVEGTDRNGDEKYEVVSVGPTTSMRMEMFEYDFIEQTGVRLIVGKGSMGPNTEAGCKEFGALHCVFPAGNAVIAATEVEEVEESYWRELGMPEALWVMRVKQFGPLIVSIDANGNNLYTQKKEEYNARKETILEDLYEKVRYIK